MDEDDFEYGVITRDGPGEPYHAVGRLRFEKKLRVGRSVSFQGKKWMIEEVNAAIWPPIVVLCLLLPS